MLLVAVPPVLFLLNFFPPRKNSINSLFLIGLHVSIYKYGVNDGFRLALGVYFIRCIKSSFLNAMPSLSNRYFLYELMIKLFALNTSPCIYIE